MTSVLLRIVLSIFFWIVYIYKLDLCELFVWKAFVCNAHVAKVFFKGISLEFLDRSKNLFQLAEAERELAYAVSKECQETVFSKAAQSEVKS